MQGGFEAIVAPFEIDHGPADPVVLFDDEDLFARRSEGGRRGQSTPTGADDDDVVGSLIQASRGVRRHRGPMTGGAGDRPPGRQSGMGLLMAGGTIFQGMISGEERGAVGSMARRALIGVVVFRVGLQVTGPTIGIAPAFVGIGQGDFVYARSRRRESV